MGDSTLPLARLFAIAFRSLVEQLHERLSAHGYADVGMNFGYVLLAARDGALTGSDVAELMNMTKQAASKLVDSMESRGYLERGEHPDDARAKILRVTPRGKRLLALVEAIYREIENEWASAIGKRELEALRSNLTHALHVTYDGKLPDVKPPP